MENPNEICPICGEELIYEKSTFIVLDGNSVFRCIKDAKHRFWKNSREIELVLHLNEYARETNFHSDADYIWENDNWVLKYTNNIKE